MTREHPILFSGALVRAILEGRKTQTRRLLRPQPVGDQVATFAQVGTVKATGAAVFCCRDDWGTPVCALPVGRHSLAGDLVCPYGAPGDHLWCRETWQEFFDDEIDPARPRGPWGRMGIPAQPERRSFVFYRADGEIEGAVWRPSIHMPRRASRLTLRIKSVRVERLQQISEADAKAEGVEPVVLPTGRYGLDICGPLMDGRRPFASEFAVLWDSINNKSAPWSSNPWLWVLEFERVGVAP